MGSVADSVVTNIQIIVDNTIIGRRHRHLSFSMMMSGLWTESQTIGIFSFWQEKIIFV